MHLKLIVLLLLLTSQSHASELYKNKTTYNPSFSCEDITNKQSIERMICNDKELSNQDRLLSVLYHTSQEKLKNPQQLTHDQRDWIKRVRNTCNSIECLKKVYAEFMSPFFSYCLLPYLCISTKLS